MGILCIKTTNQTSKLVLQHGLYYSYGIPQKNFSAVLILGEAENGKIPVLAECDVITINTCTAVNSCFSNINQNWRYEWKLHINNTFKTGMDILKYVNQTSQSYSSILHCQGISYVDWNDLKLKLPIQGNTKYVLTQAAAKLSNTKKNQGILTTNNIKAIVNIVPLGKVYAVSDIVSVKIRDGFKINECQGKITAVEDITKTDSNGNQVLIDQKLMIELPDKALKKYLASKI